MKNTNGKKRGRDAVKNKKLDASMTVEAAFVVPIVIFVIFALMYLTFQLHDKVRLETVMERALGKGDFLVSQRGREDGSAYDYENVNKNGNWGYFRSSYKKQQEAITDYLKEELGKGFFTFQMEHVNCEINGFNVQIKIVMKKMMSLHPVKNFLGESSYVTLERKKVLHSPEELLRVMDGLGIVMDYAEDTEFVKNHVVKNKTALEKE